MKSRQLVRTRREAAVETKTSQEVIDLVRQNPELGLMVIHLREAGQSWLVVKNEIAAKIGVANQARSNGRALRSGRALMSRSGAKV
jgi:hypothetical protein